MTLDELENIINYLIKKSVELKNKYVEEKDLTADYVCIFAHSQAEYQQLLHLASQIGKIAGTTKTGPLFAFDNSPETIAGKPKLLKIRLPDATHPQKGDVDFRTNYEKFKNKYLDKDHFNLIVRERFEMLELRDDSYDVLVYFSSISVSKQLGVT